MLIGVGIHYRNEYITKEHEVNMIEKEIFHKVDHWEVSYPWTSYPKNLTNHRIAAMHMLKNTARRLSQNLDQQGYIMNK